MQPPSYDWKAPQFGLSQPPTAGGKLFFYQYGPCISVLLTNVGVGKTLVNTGSGHVSIM